jgi:hypothetical protein
MSKRQVIKNKRSTKGIVSNNRKTMYKDLVSYALLVNESSYRYNENAYSEWGKEYLSLAFLVQYKVIKRYQKLGLQSLDINNETGIIQHICVRFFFPQKNDRTFRVAQPKIRTIVRTSDHPLNLPFMLLAINL